MRKPGKAKRTTLSPFALSLPPILTRLLGEHSEREPPDPIPNSEVKPLSADDSVAGCHVKVGHRQALIPKSPVSNSWAFFCPMVWELEWAALRDKAKRKKVKLRTLKGL